MSLTKNKLKEFANSFLRGNKAVLMVIVLMAAMVFLSPVFFTTLAWLSSA